MIFDSSKNYRYGYNHVSESNCSIQKISSLPSPSYQRSTELPLPRKHTCCNFVQNTLTPLKIHMSSCIDVACLQAAMFWGTTNRGKEADARQALDEKELALHSTFKSKNCESLRSLEVLDVSKSKHMQSVSYFEEVCFLINASNDRRQRGVRAPEIWLPRKLQNKTRERPVLKPSPQKNAPVFGRRAISRKRLQSYCSRQELICFNLMNKIIG